MAAPSKSNPLSGGSLTITDDKRKAYAEAWIGMADDVEGTSQWFRVGGISAGWRFLTNEGSSHKTFVAAHVLTGLAAGNHVLTLTALGGTTTDHNDFFSVSIIAL
ncbi:MAG TPA: hypothetical protein VGF23_21880 [Gaiellaceae bacterium]